MGERRIGSHTHRRWSSGRLGKKMLPLRASVGSAGESSGQSTPVFRTDARKIMVAVSIARTQYTSLNQVGNARISCRAAGKTVNRRQQGSRRHVVEPQSE